ncbi:hypothetical protein TFUB22_01904 [Tannerella forsythia]|nr:hypothetical protein TFUB22_01904 [Tannerella forsythia]
MQLFDVGVHIMVFQSQTSSYMIRDAAGDGHIGIETIERTVGTVTADQFISFRVVVGINIVFELLFPNSGLHVERTYTTFVHHIQIEQFGVLQIGIAAFDLIEIDRLIDLVQCAYFRLIVVVRKAYANPMQRIKTITNPCTGSECPDVFHSFVLQSVIH